MSFIFALTLFVGLNNSSAHAKYMGHYQMPTELRGTWYFKEGGMFWQKAKITKNRYYQHKGTTGPDVENIVGKTKEPGNNGEPIYVQKFNTHGDKFIDGPAYTLTKGDSKRFSFYWLSRKRTHGKRILRSAMISFNGGEQSDFPVNPNNVYAKVNPKRFFETINEQGFALTRNKVLPKNLKPHKTHNYNYVYKHPNKYKDIEIS
ncbi:hypothetical protein [Apilactobacillus micheneri]|uniref:hypothetical protein n=1 Tax=Apilactobacillus micheneri TaxID=1899430 RepID=UPI0015E84724|nr:hypothetical protein [Apilactobacillus micheneri]